MTEDVTSPSAALRALFAAAAVQQPADTISFLLWRVAHRHQREVDRVLAPLDLTHLQFFVLVQSAWLGRNGEPILQTALARFGKIHPMQLSNVLKTVSGKGLVVRSQRPSNARAKQVALTPAAVALLARALPRRPRCDGRSSAQITRSGSTSAPACVT